MSTTTHHQHLNRVGTAPLAPSAVFDVVLTHGTAGMVEVSGR